MRGARGARGPPRGPSPPLPREAASTRPRLGAGPFSWHLLPATRVCSGRGRGRCPEPGHPQFFLHPPSQPLGRNCYPCPQFPAASSLSALHSTVEGRSKVCSPVPAVHRWHTGSPAEGGEAWGSHLSRVSARPPRRYPPPHTQCHPDFLTLLVCTQQCVKGSRASQDAL